MTRKLDVEEVKVGDYVTAFRVSKNGKQYKFTGMVKAINDFGIVLKIPRVIRLKKISLRLYDLTKSSKRSADLAGSLANDKPAVGYNKPDDYNNGREGFHEEIGELEVLQEVLDRLENAKQLVLKKNREEAIKIIKSILKSIED